MTKLKWLVEPIYEKIINYNEKVFVVFDQGSYQVIDFNQQIQFVFNDNEIYEIELHANEGGPMQDFVMVRFKDDTRKLFSLKSLNYLHEEKYYLPQTDYYPIESGLIRIFDNLKEGLMNFQGNIILKPEYKQVSVSSDYYIGFKEEQIEVFDKKKSWISTLQYVHKGAIFIPKKKLFKVQKEVNGEPNVYKQIRTVENGRHLINFEPYGDKKFATGLIDMDNREIVPFEYSSIYNLSDRFLRVTKDEKITDEGFQINYFKPKFGLIDYSNNLILDIKYKHISVIEGELVQVEDFENRRAVFNLKTRKFETELLQETYDETALKLNDLNKLSNKIKFKSDNRIGLKNRKGEILIPAEYMDIRKTMHPDIYQVYRVTEEYGNEGYYNISLKKEIVPPIHSDRGGIGGHKANNQDVIKIMDPETDKVGFYRLDGFKISEAIYDEEIDGFSENLAPVFVEYGEKVGMIDIEGKIIYDHIFDSMTLPLNGLSIVQYNKKSGILKI